mmetsp:Transcript_19637/g.53970  ORF Transcript_19637/g.53970 Transcript_19637/m.53970 type:complete len:206 (-) Transcript_19637:664-1281(-)
MPNSPSWNSLKCPWSLHSSVAKTRPMRPHMQAIQWDISRRAALNLISFWVANWREITFCHRCRMREVRSMRSSLTRRIILRMRRISARCQTSAEAVSATLRTSKGNMLTTSTKNQDFRYLTRSAAGSLSRMLPPRCGRWISTFKKNCKTMSNTKTQSTARFTAKRAQLTVSKNTTSYGATVPTNTRATATKLSQYFMQVLRGFIR